MPRYANTIRRLGLVLPLLLGLSTAYALTGLLLVDTTPPAVKRPDIMTQAVTAGPSQNKIIMEKNILALEIPAPKDTSAEPKAPPPSDPRAWFVKGVFVRPSRSIALVIAKGATEIIFEGDELHGWTLSRVWPAGTAWTNGKAKRTLLLTPEAVAGGPSKNGRQSISVKRLTSTKFSSRVQLDRKAAAQYLESPVTLLKEALYKPHIKDGKALGFRITNIKDKSILNKIGVKNEDVLLRMNGEAVKSPTELLSAYAGLEESKTITLDVLRNGQVESILVELK